MQQEEYDEEGLHSIERSKLRGVGSSNSAKKRVVRKKRSAASHRSGARSMPSKGSAAGRMKAPARAGDSPPRKKKKRKAMYVVIAIIVAVVVFLVSTTFATSNVSIVLASTSNSFDGSFTAVRVPGQTADISFNVRTLLPVEKKELITNVERDRENVRASGTITIFNNNTALKNLELVNRTRFQTSDGRIYRLPVKTLIPAARLVNGELVPGEKEVTVDADEVGQGYNLEAGVRFSVPGLLKDESFKNVYAISKTRIGGGFSGERLKPNAEEAIVVLERLRKEIENELRSDLISSIETNSLSDNVIFDNAIFITYEELENEQIADGVYVGLKGELNTIEFRKADLAGLLSKRTELGSLVGVNPSTLNHTDLSIDFEIDPDEINSIKDFSFRLFGLAEIFWDVDQVLFLTDIAGMHKTEVMDFILQEYPQVLSIEEVSVFPLWRPTLPGNKSKISLEITHEEINPSSSTRKIEDEEEEEADEEE